MYKKISCIFALIWLWVTVTGCTQAVSTPDTQKSASDDEIVSVVETDYIYDNISVNGISMGGLTEEKAKEVLNDALVVPLRSQKIIVISDGADGKTWALELSSLNYKYDIEGAVKEAFQVARSGELFERYDIITGLNETPYEINIEPTYDKDGIDEFLADIAEEYDVAPKEPTMTRQSGAFVMSPGADGIAVNIEETKARIIELANKPEGGDVFLVSGIASPKFTVEDLKKSTQLIGAYSTPITGSAQRDVNLTVASGYVNDTLLYPDGVFSTNSTIGPTTYDRGYRNAPVIVNGRLEDGIGGGVCQVSSTLYNAVLFAELEVVERRNHSLVVGYCPIGRDATLAGDYIDFKFKNSTDYPIYVESYPSGKRLYVNIYGLETRPENRTIDFESVYVSSLIVDVFKKVMIDGKVTDTIFVDRSTYRPSAPAAPQPEEEAETPETGEVETDAAAEELPAEELPAQTEEPVNNSVLPDWLGGGSVEEPDWLGGDSIEEPLPDNIAPNDDYIQTDWDDEVYQ